jgi:energy-coupling factor transport system permease protein
MQNILVRTILSYLILFGTPMLLPVLFIKLVGLGGIRDLVTYEPRDTPLHKLDPRLKVLYPIGMGTLSIILNWDFMLIVFGLTIIPWFWLKPSRAKIRVLMVLVIGPAIAGFWSQGLYYLPPAPIHFLWQFPWTLSWMGSPGITTYGMVFGLQQTARVLVTVSTSMLILISTDVGDFTWAFERFRMPPAVGFAMTAALRFLPEMVARTTLVLRAVELRGYDMSRPRFVQFTKWPDYVRRLSRAIVIITVPLLVGSLRGTTTMAMVADARGFGVNRRRGSLVEHPTTKYDIAGYVILVGLVVTAIVLRIFHIGARPY